MVFSAEFRNQSGVATGGPIWDYRRVKPNFLILFILVAAFAMPFLSKAGPVPKPMHGDWTFTLPNGQNCWLSIVGSGEGEPQVSMLVDVGTTKPLKGVEMKDKKLHVPLRTYRKGKKGPIISTNRAEIWWDKEGNKLEGEVITNYPDGKEDRNAFTGKRIPPMPPAPDLSKVKWGEPVELFNGEDLAGWKPRRPEKINGWSVEDGLLVNTTPKTDFSATGAYANLQTIKGYGDCKLHIEFLVGKDRNSGIYVQGMYEAQVVDRDSRMQGISGVGAIFGRVAPTKNAGYEGGKWQTYDITLVDRHMTVVLNGEKVIDNQPVPGPTAGALHTDPMTPGPLYLQGDHTTVSYRNIVLTPRAE